MSQDRPNSQPPSPEPGASQPETQTAQTTSKRTQTLLKQQSIKALRGTIQVLEGVLVKLEAQPPATIRETPSFLDKLQMAWSGILAKIRSLLPENLSSKLSDPGLTIIIAAIVAIGVWTTSALLPGKPTEVANVPPETSVPTANLTTPPSEPVPTANLTTPPELTAPAAPQPIEEVPPPSVSTPAPTLELTPEQNLIASIQTQVAEITEQYANGLIQLIQANFQNSSLIIKVGDDWYNFKQPQQDKLAAQMLERSKELDFSHLEITDSQGTLLARSPVVGNDMVILKRQMLGKQQETKA